MKYKIYSSIIFILLLCNCSTVGVHTYRLSNDTYEQFPPTDRNRIQLIDSIDSINTEFKHIGVIHVQGSAFTTSYQSMLDKLLAEASKIGANALFIKGFNRATDEQIAHDLLLNQGIATNRLSAIALYIYDTDTLNYTKIKVFKQQPKSSKYVGTISIIANTKSHLQDIINNAKILAQRLNASFIIPVDDSLDKIQGENAFNSYDITVKFNAYQFTN